MTLLTSSMSSSHRAQAAEFRRRIYLNDGWTTMQRWDGIAAATVDAGIVGPSQAKDSWTCAPTTGAGNTDVGIHTYRYRYLDSETGYVSDPSEERQLDVASGAEALTFPIAAVGGAAPNMLRTADTKVDRFVIEMTVVNGSAFFKAAEGPSSAASLVVNVSDASLKQLFLPWPEDGHKPSPIAKNLLSYQDRLWLFGEVEHSTGTVDVANGSADVTENTANDWSADALGTSAGDADFAWLFTRDGDARAYEVSYYDSAGPKLVLSDNYAGVTGTNVAYKLTARVNVVWVSRSGYPEAFVPLQFINGPNGERAGDFTAGVGFGTSVVFFSAAGMWGLSWGTDPLVDPRWTPLSTFYGALSQRVVLHVEGVVYSMDRRGWMAWRGTVPEHISRPIDSVLATIDFDQLENFHAVWHPVLRAIRWFYCISGDTYPRNYVQLDVDTRNWSTGTFLQGISESAIVPTSTGLQVFYGDENGHVWQADTGTCDGCDASLSHLTVAAAATTTSIPVDETLPTTNAGVSGCYAHWVEGDETRLVSLNTASTLTVAAFSTAPTLGDTIWLAPIPWRLRSPAFSLGLSRVSRFRYAWLFFAPHASARLILARFFGDYGATALEVAQGWDRKDPPGLVYPGNVASAWTVASGAASDWLVQINTTGGVVKIPCPSEFRRTLELELEGIEADAHFELIGIELDGEDLERGQE